LTGTDHFSELDDGSSEFLLWRFEYFLTTIVVVIVWLYSIVKPAVRSKTY